MRTIFSGLLAAASLFSTAFLAAQDNAELFSKLDTNKDGFVTADEVQDSQKAMFERLLRNADKDGDKKLSKEEFQAGLKPDEAPRPTLAGGPGPQGRPGGGQFNPQELFNRFDANKDGKLSKDELPPRLQENFARLDANGDGALSQDEFARAAGPGQRPPGTPGGAPNRAELEALFDRTDSNSDGKLTKDEIPEERQGMRAILERSGGDSLNKEQFVRGMMAMAQQFGGQPPQPGGAPSRRPDGPPRPDGAPLAGAIFAALDTDRNGELSTVEIASAGAVLVKLDRNGDGKVTPDEFFGPSAGPPPRRPGEGPPPGAPPEQRRPGQRGLFGVNPEQFRAVLKEADANNDGKISKEEAPALIKDRFDRIDANSDGFVDEAEVSQLLQRFRDAYGKAPPRRPGADQPRPDGDKK